MVGGSKDRPRHTHTLGGWLPTLTNHIKSYILDLKEKVKNRGAAELDPTVQALKDLIYDDGRIYAAASSMIQEAKDEYYDDMEPGEVMIQDIDEMCDLVNEAIQEPPPYNDYALVAFPINAIFDLVMATSGGYGFFASEKVNHALKAILDKYGVYLSSDASLIAFTEGGWSSPEAVAKLNMDTFQQPNPNAPGWGYQSWNDWFIRPFKDGQRPIADPSNPKVIVSACESTPYAFQKNVQLRDTFWAKNQNYSLAHMIDSEEDAKEFVGGTVMQAFLSAFEYHRWHAPVDGMVVDAKVVPGTYYSQTPAVGLDHAGPDQSQGYISSVAARAVMKIKCDEASVGDMYVIAIGMAEVSSSIITVPIGHHVKKGDQLGYFQFGGSSHALIFRKGAIASWQPQVHDKNRIMKVSSHIATAN